MSTTRAGEAGFAKVWARIKGFGRKAVFRIANLAIIWGVAITGARDGILVNQEREYGKKIRRELNVTVVCWCWIVQDEKENVQI